MFLSIMGIILPAFATVLTACDADKFWIACVTAIATVISGILAYLKCFDKHEAYRKAAENMKAELVAFAAEQGAYKSGSTKPKDESCLSG